LCGLRIILISQLTLITFSPETQEKTRHSEKSFHGLPHVKNMVVMLHPICLLSGGVVAFHAGIAGFTGSESDTLQFRLMSFVLMLVEPMI
jgi:hypothetical protein